MAVATMESISAQEGEIDYDDIMARFISWWTEGACCSLDSPFGLWETISRAMSNYKAGVLADACGPKGLWDNGNGAVLILCADISIS